MERTFAQAHTWLEQYEQQGYLLLKHIIKPDIINRLRDFVYTQFIEQLQALWKQMHAPIPQIFSLQDMEALKNYVNRMTSQKSRFEALPKDLQHLLRGEFPLSVRLKQEFLAIIDAEALMDVLKTLSNRITGTSSQHGKGLRMHYPPMVRFKVPDLKQANVPLHQDWSYNAHMDQFVSVWVPLCKITEDCGGVNILEGSHRLGKLEHKQQVVWGNYVGEEFLRRGYVDKHILMDLGDALLFGPYTLHYSHDNASLQARCSIDYRFFPSTVYSSKHYFDLQTKRIVQPDGQV
jgi:hypothetical protein